MSERLAGGADDLIAAIYQAAGEAISPSRPLELLAERTHADKAFAGRFNTEHRRASIIASFNVEPNFFETYKEVHGQDHPWLGRNSYFQAEGLVWRGTDIIDHAKLATTQFYSLFMYPQYMHHTLHLVIRVRGPDVFHVVLTRRPDADDFDSAAMEICRLFALHARHAFEISAAAGLSRFVDNGFAKAMDDVAVGVAVIEAPAAVRYMNHACDLLLNGRRDDGHATARMPWQGRVPTPRMPRCLIDVLAQRPVPSSFVIRPAVDEWKRPVFVSIRQYYSDHQADGHMRTGYVVLCRSADTEIEVDETALRGAFNLTATEARVASALVAGDNIVGVAKRLEISPETVRTHIKHVLEKTYTNRQPELMKLLMSVAHRKVVAPPGAAVRDLFTATPALPRKTGIASADD